MNYETITVENLLLLNTPFHFTYGEPPAVLEKSIQSIGVREMPVLVYDVVMSCLRLVHGRRRIQIAHAINPQSTLKVIVYSPRELTDLEAFRLNFFENLAIRPFNPIEKSLAMSKLRLFNVPDETIIQEYLPLLGLPPKTENLGSILRLLELPSHAQNLVSRLVVQADSALMLLPFPIEDQKILISMIETLHLGINPQKTLIRTAWEILRKNGLSVRDLFESENVHQILSKDWTHAQKWMRIEAMLMRKRYPTLNKIEDRFLQAKKSLKLPPSISLQSPAYFETSDYMIHLRFKNLDEYKRQIQYLKSQENNPALSEIFKLTGEHE